MNIELLTKTFHPQVFSGKVYGVTGGAHGIGEAVVRGLCALGGSVVIIDLDGQNLRRVGEAIGDSAIGVQGDVTDPAVIDRALKAAQDRWGRLDGWVNNAMLNPNDHPDGQSEGKFLKTFEINLLAAWRIIHQIAPIIDRHGEGGSIVNISTIMADMTVEGNCAYTTTKAGLEGLTRSKAVDLAPKRIRVNSVSPGMIRSYCGANHLAGVDRKDWPQHEQYFAEMVEEMSLNYQPWIDPGLPVHLAGGVLFLLSPASTFITGTDLAIDGGCSVQFLTIDQPRRLTAGRKVAELRQKIKDSAPGKPS